MAWGCICTQGERFGAKIVNQLKLSAASLESDMPQMKLNKAPAILELHMCSSFAV